MTEARADGAADSVGIVASGLAYVALAFAPWFESRAGSATLTLTGWNSGFAGVVAVLLAAYAAGRVVLLRYRPQRADVPLAPTAEPFAAALAAFGLAVYRLLAVPYIGSVRAERTSWLALATLVVLLQAVFATRGVARTGFRAAP